MQPTQRFGRLLIMAIYVALPDPLDGWPAIFTLMAATVAWDWHIKRVTASA